jgi:LmbE family N-acetylglucosaminyl deacetylase
MNLRRLADASKASARFYLDLLKYGERPKPLSEPPAAKQVLVLAPHPDDETIGCGGVIRRYADGGTPVTVVFISDGSAGFEAKGLSKEERQARALALVETRKQEAQRAAAVLGIGDCVFLGIEDGNVSASPENVALLSEALQRLRPDIVFLPFVMDQHTDHYQTNLLFLAAATGLDGKRVECWAYEIWTPLYANRLVDITPVADVKWQALRQYESQARHLDYVASVQGLNAFRQRTAYQGAGYAEAFFAASLADYRELCGRLYRP